MLRLVLPQVIRLVRRIHPEGADHGGHGGFPGHCLGVQRQIVRHIHVRNHAVVVQNDAHGLVHGKAVSRPGGNAQGQEDSRRADETLHDALLTHRWSPADRRLTYSAGRSKCRPH